MTLRTQRHAHTLVSALPHSPTLSFDLWMSEFPR